MRGARIFLRPLAPEAHSAAETVWFGGALQELPSGRPLRCPTVVASRGLLG
jgi:hypothetical protein